MKSEIVKLIRYPGGKHRILKYILPYLPLREYINGRFVEPFLGSGAVFFALNPKRSLLSDINAELIDLYRGIRRYPLKVWEIYKSFPKTKKAYYKIRAVRVEKMELAFRAARTLYLNRTCFKGMWRHNSNGVFNVGYGGQERRWVVNKEILIKVSNRLKRSSLKCRDFEETINACTKDSFIFIDPPYRPGELEMTHSHYTYRKFTYTDHMRLANSLKKATNRGVKWIMTTTSHKDILDLFKGNNVRPLPKGTGKRPGILTDNSGEFLIYNY